MIGSSPRERGTHRRLIAALPGNRFIPARAGNAIHRRHRPQLAPVHPRASGERRILGSHVSLGSGSSPRERGTRRRRGRRAQPVRFIPARAGNAPAGPSRRPGRSVHPRASGERRWARSSALMPAGSSPRERGTLFLEELDLTDILRCQTAHRQIRHFSAARQRLPLACGRVARTAPA